MHSTGFWGFGAVHHTAISVHRGTTFLFPVGAFPIRFFIQRRFLRDLKDCWAGKCNHTKENKQLSQNCLLLALCIVARDNISIQIFDSERQTKKTGLQSCSQLGLLRRLATYVLVCAIDYLHTGKLDRPHQKPVQKVASWQRHHQQQLVHGLPCDSVRALLPEPFDLWCACVRQRKQPLPVGNEQSIHHIWLHIASDLFPHSDLLLLHYQQVLGPAVSLGRGSLTPLTQKRRNRFNHRHSFRYDINLILTRFRTRERIKYTQPDQSDAQDDGLPNDWRRRGNGAVWKHWIRRLRDGWAWDAVWSAHFA